ncbi:DUF3515 domain-containing protein [Streptomyces liangshanensis]|uniref:DUF3515 domain-containing protein n=1 Tax=Streptomyces liangshanensis TaxID=2717324 RepID=UPI0036DE5DA4
MTVTRRRLSRRRLSGRPLLVVPAVALLLAAAGCSSADAGSPVAVPSPGPGEAKLCGALHKALPRTLGGLERDDPRPRSELTAGWGDDAIVLRCGVPRPEEMDDPQANAVDADGVNWMLEQLDSGARFTTTYRKAYVEVTMGPRFANDATPLAALAAPVARTVPSSL